jgi:hypothetical protein
MSARVCRLVSILWKLARRQANTCWLKKSMSKNILAPSFQLMSNWCALGWASYGICVAASIQSEVLSNSPNHKL